ncbi:MAG: glutathione S-transferase family protein [Pseudomonadota bacterium]
MSLTLIIGNRNYSSWSLRAWLFLQESQVEFETIRIPLFKDDWREELAKYTPAGRVPVLLDGDITVWDSMAIMAHMQERFPSAVGWPKDPVARAAARSISAEMHAGFMAIREHLPQNIRERYQINSEHIPEPVQHEIARISDIWSDCYQQYSRPNGWLFGELSTADIMYAPVALRFLTYGIQLPEPAQTFISKVQNLAAIKTWQAMAAEETETLDFFDDLPIFSPKGERT